MKVRTSTDNGSIREEAWTDPGSLGIGGATSETNVIYTRTWGNDTTGNGTLATPYATASKAYSVWSSGKVLDFGIGSFGAGTFANSGATLYLRGMHSRKTLLGAITTSGNSVTIISDGNVTIESIDANGSAGSAGSNGSTGATGSNPGGTGDTGGSGGSGGSGDSGGTITLVKVRVTGNVEANGGAGGNGGSGGTGGDGGPGDVGTTGGNGGNGGTGGDAGDGGAGGTLNCYDSFVLGTFQCSQGSPGSYGSGGSGGNGGSDGGAGPGTNGSPGMDGNSAGGSSDGYANLYRSYLNSSGATPTVYTDWTYDDGPS